MIDLHSHILPHVDDGAQSIEQALVMAKMAVSNGISIVAATPHHHDGTYINEKLFILERVSQFNQTLQDNEIPLTVIPGQELHFHERMIDDFYDGNIIATLNHSKYVLLEFPVDEVPSGTAEMLHEFKVLGIVPIIAHPERNKEIAQNHDRLTDLIEWGALSQVTSQSLAGKFGSKVQRTALDLCRKNLIHIVASDAHNVTSRPFLMTEAFEVVRKELGEPYVSYFLTNAEKVYEDDVIVPMEPLRIRRNRLFFWKN